MVTLTTAHVHDKLPANSKLMNLAALCNRCHLNHDRHRRPPDERIWKELGFTRKTKRGTVLTRLGEAEIGDAYYFRKVRYGAR